MLTRPLTSADVARRRAEVEARFGPWTSHNMELAPGVWTRPGRGDEGHGREFNRLLAVVTGLIDRDMLRRKADLLGALQRTDARAEPDRYRALQLDLVTLEADRRALRAE